MGTPEEIAKDPLAVKELFHCEEFIIKQLSIHQDSKYIELLYNKFIEVSKLTFSVRQLLGKPISHKYH